MDRINDIDLEQQERKREREQEDADALAGTSENRIATEQLTAEEIKKINDELGKDSLEKTKLWNEQISGLMVAGVKDWGSAFEKFKNYVVDYVLKELADEIVKAIGLGKALKSVLGGIGGGGVIGPIWRNSQ
jgi:hypothetical protein